MDVLNRVPVREQEPQVRAANFEEVCLGYNEEEAKAEAARCLNCKNAQCMKGCPVSINIPAFIAQVKEGNFEEAYHIISQSSALPAVCGRVCPQESQCEGKCIRGIKGEPVAIGKLERFVADWARENDIKPKKAEKLNGHKVAVIGSGPAGLTCAGDLAKLGYDVTIFEALHEAGGVLIYGIPEFRLPKQKVVAAEVENVKALGVKIETNVVIGKSVTIDELMENEGFEAVFIGSGAGLPRFMGIPGEQAMGVFSANEFLTRNNLMKAFLDNYDTPIKAGKKVIVVGGGNVAMDVARSSIRLGASKVSIVYRRRKADMTALEEEVEGAEAEGCDVLELMSPVRIKQDEEGNAIGLIVKPQMISRVSHGRPAPKAAAKDEVLLESDLIVVAIGQGIETKSFEEHGIKVQRGVISALNTGNITPQDGEMSEGVFAGGDCVTGPATVIKAIAAGKVAAANIDEYLGFNHEITCDVEIPYASNEDKVACGRVEVALRDAAERKNDFEPIEYGFSCEEACQEAGRCLRCDHFGFGAFRGGREEQW